MVRYVVELECRPDGGVEGFLVLEGSTRRAAFTGWMELMTLLQPPQVDEPRWPVEMPETWSDAAVF